MQNPKWKIINTISILFFWKYAKIYKRIWHINNKWRSFDLRTNYNISGFPRFNSPIELSDSVINAGFNAILKTTNHVNDKNEEAKLVDLNNWERFPDIKIIGSYKNETEAERITYFDIKGVKIALLNYCYGRNKILKNLY